MDAGATTTSVMLDASKLSVRELNETLAKLPKSVASVEIIGSQSPHLLVSGFTSGCRVTIEGDLGDYCLCGLANAEVEVRGRAGCGLGEAMESGSILLHGDAGDAAGAFNRGGLVAIYQNAGRRAGVAMAGGDLVVKGSIGSQGAMRMTDGTLLVLGSAGPMLGQDMRGGTIYIRGDIESLAPQMEETRLREADRLRIGLLFLKSGIEGEARELRAYKAVIS